MGGRLGRNRNPPENDPFYSAQPPGGGSFLPPLQADPTGLAGYDPNLGYGYTDVVQPTVVAPMENYYGTGRRRVAPTTFAGRYAQGMLSLLFAVDRSSSTVSLE